VDCNQEWRVASFGVAQFDVFVTVDRNLSFQQNIGAINMAVIVLKAQIDRLNDLKILILKLLTVIGSAKRGLATIVGE